MTTAFANKMVKLASIIDDKNQPLVPVDKLQFIVREVDEEIKILRLAQQILQQHINKRSKS